MKEMLGKLFLLLEIYYNVQLKLSLQSQGKNYNNRFSNYTAKNNL